MKFKTLDEQGGAKREIRAGDVLESQGSLYRYVIVALKNNQPRGVESIRISVDGGVSGVDHLLWGVAQNMKFIGRVRDFENITLEIEPA